MSDTAQTTDVNDIWSMPEPTVKTPTPTADDPVINTGFRNSSFPSGGESLGSSRPEMPASNSAEVFRPPENLVTPEIGEKLKPVEVAKPAEEKPKENPTPVVHIAEEPKKAKVVDKRTVGGLKTHRVADVADSITKRADIKEQEFIAGVEQIHAIV